MVTNFLETVMLQLVPSPVWIIIATLIHIDLANCQFNQYYNRFTGGLTNEASSFFNYALVKFSNAILILYSFSN